MRTLLLIVSALLWTMLCTAQTGYRIMVIPFARDGEDIRTVLDEDANRRIAIAKVKEGLDAAGYTTVDFAGRLNAARSNQAFAAGTQTDVKSRLIEMAGCDAYVVAETDVNSDTRGSSANVILTAYDVSTGNSLASKVGTSGKFFTNDLGKLTARAVDMCIGDFANVMTGKLREMEDSGRPLLIDFSFAAGSEANMTTPVEQHNGMPLSELLESWLAKNSIGGRYHIQGITRLKLIADEVRVPVVKTNGTAYSTNEYATEVCKFIEKAGLHATKDVKAGTIYITIN